MMKVWIVDVRMVDEKQYRMVDSECVNNACETDQSVDDGDGLMTNFWMVKMRE